jgi:hypothetical protein
MDYFREFYGIISSRPKFLAVMAYKLCPKAQKFHGKVWIVFRNFMEIPPTALGHHSPLLISLIPGARNFMELYGLFMEILWKTWPSPRPLRDITGEPMENSRIFMENSMENLWNGGSIKFDF